MKHGGNAVAYQSLTKACPEAKIGSPDTGIGCSGLIFHSFLTPSITESEATQRSRTVSGLTTFVVKSTEWYLEKISSNGGQSCRSDLERGEGSSEGQSSMAVCGG
jgi:hypothetical protein